MDLWERLRREFGNSVAVRAASGADAVDGIAPQAVAAPRDEAAACALLKWCGREKLAIIARGGGTKIEIGARPVRFDVLISTEHLNRVIEHDEGNATVTAEAGISLRILDAEVGRRGQFVPLEGAGNLVPVEAAEAMEATGASQAAGPTLGGVASANQSGVAQLKYGAPRDLVVGLHAALPDGRLVKAGGKVVKNVSGYDLNKLFVGSFGTLGLITRVTLRLRPHDAVRRTLGAACDSWPEAMSLARRILDGPFEPVVLRVCVDDGGFRLRAAFAGGQTAVQSQIECLPAAAWSERPTEPPDTVGRQDDHSVRMRAILPLGSAAFWAQTARREGADSISWDCGVGLVHACFEQVPDVAVLRDEAARNTGFVLVERAPVALKTPAFVWGAPRPDFVLMKRLKAKFDPAGICAPGRFVGGLGS
jgi:glycolate oxidase FAD binding subunit